MENWIRLMRAYKNVHTVNIGDLKVGNIIDKLKTKQVKEKTLQINMRWGKLVRKYLQRHYSKINDRWKRLIENLAK